MESESREEIYLSAESSFRRSDVTSWTSRDRETFCEIEPDTSFRKCAALQLELSTLAHQLKQIEEQCQADLETIQCHSTLRGAIFGDHLVDSRDGTVMVAMDTSAEIRTDALEHCLAYLTHGTSNVIVIAVLHQFYSPMGYQVRVDTEGFNGVNRTVLDREICHKLKLYQLAFLRLRDEFKQKKIKMEIVIVAGSICQHVVVGIAKILSPKWIVLDREFNNERKYYIEKLDYNVDLMCKERKFRPNFVTLKRNIFNDSFHPLEEMQRRNSFSRCSNYFVSHSKRIFGSMYNDFEYKTSSQNLDSTLSNMSTCALSRLENLFTFINTPKGWNCFRASLTKKCPLSKTPSCKKLHYSKSLENKRDLISRGWIFKVENGTSIRLVNF